MERSTTSVNFKGSIGDRLSCVDLSRDERHDVNRRSWLFHFVYVYLSIYFSHNNQFPLRVWYFQYDLKSTTDIIKLSSNTRTYNKIQSNNKHSLRYIIFIEHCIYLWGVLMYIRIVCNSNPHCTTSYLS